MKWEQLPLGPLQTNCYLIINSENSCLIIDPGEEGSKLINEIEKKNLKPQAILLTHAHFDHIGAVDVIREKYAIPVYIHENEADWLTNPSLNGSTLFFAGQISLKPSGSHLIAGEKKMTIGDFDFEVLETPGHSPGSVSYYFKEGDFIASGDALFQGSIGRTDLNGGSCRSFINSIHNRLLVLPENTVVLPGHGPTTTIRREMDSNPFLNGFL